MKKFNDEKYCKVLRVLNEMVPFKEAEYFNMCFASAIEKEVKLTETKIMKTLLNGVEDEFITYGQALTLNEIYKNILIK